MVGNNAGLPFQEAIDYFRAKTRIPTKRWTDIYAEHHARAFMVAGATRDTLLADFQMALDKAISDGTTLNEFRKDFDNIVSRNGWTYKGKRGWRTRVIFETNIRQAYNAGRHAQQEEAKKDKPFKRYVAVADGRTRPEHMKWHDIILPADDPFWDSHSPMNGWNCRCSVQALDGEQVKGFGKNPKKLKAPEVKQVTKQIDVGGQKVAVRLPEGIDPGFEYSPGRAAFGKTSLEARALAGHDSYTDLPLPHGNLPQAPGLLPSVSPGTGLANRIRGAVTAGLLRKRLRAVLDGGEEKIFTDPVGGKVKVTTALADHIAENKKRSSTGRERFFPLIPELIKDPAEIWVGFAKNEATGKVVLRRRYVKLIEIEKKHTMAMVADQDNGHWSAFTMFTARGQLTNIRKGLRIYRKD